MKSSPETEINNKKYRKGITKNEHKIDVIKIKPALVSFIQSRPNSSKKDMTLAGYRLIEIDSLSRRSMRVEPKESNKPLFHPMCPDGINFLIFFFFKAVRLLII